MKKILLSFLGFFFLASVLFYWTNFGGDFNFFLRTVVYTGAPLLALISGIFALKAFGINLKNPFFGPIFFLTAAILCWLIGEGLWSYYDFVLGTDPFPSLADFFYILAYPLFFTALLIPLLGQTFTFKKVDPLLLFLLIFTFLILSFIVLYFGVYLAYDQRMSGVENFFTIAYGVGDFILLLTCLMVLILAWEYRKGTLMVPWLYFFCGLLSILAADISFAIFEPEYLAKLWPYYPGTDCLWIQGYLFMVLSFYEFRNLVKSAQARVKFI